LRQIDFLDRELGQADRVIADDALRLAEIRRLISVPGVNVITAATFMAAIGEIGRFASPRRLVGYLSVDPRVRQSGLTAAAHGRISTQGSPSARFALVEAAWSVVRQPGPLRAFYQRVRARRGHQVAIVAGARKHRLSVLVLAHPGEDYAYAQPSLTRKKLRRLELAAGAPPGKVAPGPWATNVAMRAAERELARKGEAAYERTVADWRAHQEKKGAGATPGRASRAARQESAPEPAL
jgi:transposase